MEQKRRVQDFQLVLPILEIGDEIGLAGERPRRIEAAINASPTPHGAARPWPAVDSSKHASQKAQEHNV
jgi:hypothetical protein